MGTAGLALALAACGGGEDPPPRAPAPSATRAAEPAPPAERRVRFRAADGKGVAGVFRPAGGAAPAVVLVNGLVGGAGQWERFAPYLRDAGIASLTYDGRGGVDAAELAEEVTGALAFLRRRADVDPERLGIVGSSIGGATALLALTGPDGRLVRAAVAISPPTASPLEALVARDRFHPRDVLFLTDQREKASVTPFARDAPGSRLVVSEQTGHGVALLDGAANRGAVLDWLAARLG
ncbi:MAG TPA: alpha/beta fold hydrolase [Solirubrobacteraceae bacterium]|nr:alpha/beta fold hydrolase [Solirubrobacteraceae bacterium]